MIVFQKNISFAVSDKPCHHFLEKNMLMMMMMIIMMVEFSVQFTSMSLRSL